MDSGVQIVNAASVFTAGCEVYYSIRTLIDKKDYPQVHDFYEIILVTENQLDLLLNHDLLNLKQGSLLLICPGDVHTKIENGPSTHINLAFPNHTVEALFRYLYNSSNPLQELSDGSHVPIVSLTRIDTIMIQNRLTYLNQLSPSFMREKNAHLRAILIDILYTCIMPKLEKSTQLKQVPNLPSWLSSALDGFSNTKNLALGMDYLVSQTKRSPEHICRTFQKYLGATPSSYINSRRLNYATNLLLHTDMEIVDVIYESGFQSINYFYHLFKKEYGTAPLKYKKMHPMRNL